MVRTHASVDAVPGRGCCPRCEHCSRVWTPSLSAAGLGAGQAMPGPGTHGIPHGACGPTLLVTGKHLSTPRLLVSRAKETKVEANVGYFRDLVSPALLWEWGERREEQTPGVRLSGSCSAAHSCADASPAEGVTRPVPAVSAAGDALTTRRAARALTGVRLAPPGFGPPPSCFWLSGAPAASGTDVRPCRVIGFPYCPGVRTWVSEDQTALARRCCGSCEESLRATAEQRGSLAVRMGTWGGGGWRRAVRPLQSGVKPPRSRAPLGLLRHLSVTGQDSSARAQRPSGPAGA